MIEPRFRLIKEVTITEDTAKLYVNTDTNGDSFQCNEMIIKLENMTFSGTGSTCGIGFNMGNKFYDADGCFIYTQAVGTFSIVHAYIKGGRFFADCVTNLPNAYSMNNKTTTRQ